MNDPSSLRVLAVLGLAGALSLTLAAPRQEAPLRAIRAPGVGRVEMTPTHLELCVVVEGEADVAADAWAAYGEVRRRAIAAFEGLGVDGLRVVPLGHQVAYGPPIAQSPNMGVTYPGVPDPLEGTRFWEVVLVEVAGVDGTDESGRAELGATLIDTAIDEGLNILGGLLVPRQYQPRTMEYDYAAELPLRWRLPERAALEARARTAAIADARRQALEVAEASGGALGAVLEVTLQPAKLVHTYRRPYGHYGMPQAGTLLEEAPYGGVVQVEASVRFALE